MRQNSGEETFDADVLIEELMREAEADPGLRALSGIGQQQQQQKQKQQQEETLQNRPYRTHQDLVIECMFAQLCIHSMQPMRLANTYAPMHC